MHTTVISIEELNAKHTTYKSLNKEYQILQVQKIQRFQ